MWCRYVVDGAAGDALSQHTLDKPPTSSEKLLLRWERDVLVSAATSTRTCLLTAAHVTAASLPTLLLIIIILLLDPSSSYVQF